MNIIDKLKERGILKDITNIEKFKKLIGNESIYIGFDPTATSLHLGNYVQIMILKRFAKYGFNPIAILGGATGMIGDPSGKSSERDFLSKDKLIKNQQSVKQQLQYFKLKVIDNYDFYKDMNILEFMRKVGKNLNINYMISKDAVSSRMEKGISFTEFSYQLIQGWDFKKLYDNENVRIQIGGSDQWGNITSGIELIRKTVGDDNLALGITTNLLTTSQGKKFGKSEGNAIWLDKNLTSPFQMYQYLISTTDDDVEKLLNWLTFLSKEKIKEIMLKHNATKYLRYAQKRLAYEIVTGVHSKEEADNSVFLTNILFGKISIKDLSKEQVLLLDGSIPTFENIEGNILDVLIKIKLAVSKREAREFLNNGSITINSIIIADETFLVDKYGYGNVANIIKKGKKHIVLVKNTK